MKKILFTICMAIVMFAVSGCKKDVHMSVSYYTVEQNKWLTSNNLDYYYAAYENIDITKRIMENGCVSVYLVDADGRDNPLPCEIFRSWDNNGTTNYYSDNFSYDVEPGVITFKFQSSDFSTNQSVSTLGNVVFKVCVFEN